MTMNEEVHQSFESGGQAGWRKFLITSIKPFVGRTVSDLTPKEFAALRSLWLPRAEEKWDFLDENIRAHYYAIMARISHETSLQESRPTNATPQPLEPITRGPSHPANEAKQTVGTEMPSANRLQAEALRTSAERHDEAVSSAEESEQLAEANEPQQAIAVAERSQKATEMVLGWIERARDDLRKARTYDEFKAIKDSAQLAGDFAAVMEASTQARNEAEEMRLRAERGMSLILKDPLTQRHESGRLKWGREIPFPAQSGLEAKKGFSWAKLGIEKNEASRLRKIAEFSDQEFEQRLEERSQSGQLIRSSFLSDKAAQKRGPKVPSREDCLRLLLRLLDQLSRLSERSFDQDFLSSQKLEKAAYQKNRQELTRFLQSVDAFIQTP
jgi:hypothetical protein